VYYDDYYDFSDGAVARIRYHFCNFEEEEHTFVLVLQCVGRISERGPSPHFSGTVSFQGFGVNHRLHFFSETQLYQRLEKKWVNKPKEVFCLEYLCGQVDTSYGSKRCGPGVTQPRRRGHPTYRNVINQRNILNRVFMDDIEYLVLWYMLSYKHSPKLSPSHIFQALPLHHNPVAEPTPHDDPSAQARPFHTCP